MSRPEQDAESVAAALGALVQSAAQTSTAAESEAGRARLLMRAEVESKRRWPALSFRVGVPLLAAACCALVVWWRVPSALHYEVIGAHEDGSYVSAPSDRAVSVSFSDETLVRVLPGSRLRVEETSRQGARVLLERGAAGVHVVHREHAHWVFVAGPFEVLVTGTRFDLEWDPAREVLELRLQEGSVEMHTPFGSAPVALRAGQDFRADLVAHSMTTTDVAAETSAHHEPPGDPAATESAAPPAVEPAPALEPVPEAVASAPVSPGTGAPAAPAPVARPWSKLVAAGEFGALLAQANERGIPSCLRDCTASELSALGDAARYSGRADLADQSLRALHSRFARDPEGRAAAFLLGRLREARGAASDARTWYERYLSETPAGAYAAEALAGKMRTTLTLDGQSGAEPIAREYLRLYPTGVHAKTARGILGSH